MVLIMLIALSPVHAATLSGIDFPDQTQVKENKLVLNGLGIRAASFLKVKVYVIGLYLEKRSSDAKSIIESSQAKRIEMHFVHDVTAKDLRKGWSEAFDNNYPDTAGIRKEISQFNDSMRDVKSGDQIALEFHGDTLEVSINSTSVATIKGRAFQKAALSIWLGSKPPNDELKVGILGG